MTTASSSRSRLRAVERRENQRNSIRSSYWPGRSRVCVTRVSENYMLLLVKTAGKPLFRSILRRAIFRECGTANTQSSLLRIAKVMRNLFDSR